MQQGRRERLVPPEEQEILALLELQVPRDPQGLPVTQEQLGQQAQRVQRERLVPPEEQERLDHKV